MNTPKILELLELCLTISDTTEHDVFFEYYPHLELVGVRYHFNGLNNDIGGTSIPWVKTNEKDRDFDMVMDVLKEELL